MPGGAVAPGEEGLQLLVEAAHANASELCSSRTAWFMILDVGFVMACGMVLCLELSDSDPDVERLSSTGNRRLYTRS